MFQVEIMGGMQQVVRLATREQGRGSIVQGQFDTETLCPTAVLPFIPREDPDLEPMKLFGQLEPRVMELPQKRLHVLPIRRPALERKDQSLGLGITGRVFTGKNTAGEVRGQRRPCGARRRDLRLDAKQPCRSRVDGQLDEGDWIPPPEGYDARISMGEPMDVSAGNSAETGSLETACTASHPGEAVSSSAIERPTHGKKGLFRSQLEFATPEPGSISGNCRASRCAVSASAMQG